MKVHPLASVLAGLARLISGANARWLDCEPSLRQRVYFANHTSHLDFVVLWASLPQEVRARTRPVAARDYWEQGLRRRLAEDVFHAVLIDREFARATPGEGMSAARGLMDQLVAALGDDSSLILFPEGTRGSGEAVGAFRSGLYHLCRRKPGLELVPVYMENLNRILPKGEVLPVPLLSSVTFGPPMQLQPGEDKREFLERARQALVGLRPE